jgi:hypothetical protein
LGGCPGGGYLLFDNKSIMNRQEFEAMAESWYQRTHRLREYYFDECRDQRKRDKAFRLFLEMTGRMMNISQTYIQMTMPPPPKGFKEGAYIPNRTV